MRATVQRLAARLFSCVFLYLAATETWAATLTVYYWFSLLHFGVSAGRLALDGASHTPGNRLASVIWRLEERA